MRNKVISLFGVVVMSLALSACSDESLEKDGGIVDATQDGVAADMTGDMTTDGSPPPAEYKFVKIEDLSTVTGAQDGADIDAVELQKSGTSSWAASAVSCKLPDGSDCTNPDKAVGASDAFCTNPTTQCFSNVEVPTDDPLTIPPYASLGGDDGTTKGTLIVQMSDKIENGDTLTIYELGNCDVSAQCSVTKTNKATPESIKVSVGTTASGPWTEVLAASDTLKHPMVEITISGLL